MNVPFEKVRALEAPFRQLDLGSDAQMNVPGRAWKWRGRGPQVVSMPSWELFERHCREHPEYREEVLPAQVKARVSVEQASEFGWERYVGTGKMIGMNTFGASAPLKELQTKFGFTPGRIVEAAAEQLRLERSRKKGAAS